MEARNKNHNPQLPLEIILHIGSFFPRQLRWKIFGLNKAIQKGFEKYEDLILNDHQSVYLFLSNLPPENAMDFVKYYRSTTPWRDLSNKDFKQMSDWEVICFAMFIDDIKKIDIDHFAIALFNIQKNFYIATLGNVFATYLALTNPRDAVCYVLEQIDEIFCADVRIIHLHLQMYPSPKSLGLVSGQEYKYYYPPDSCPCFFDFKANSFVNFAGIDLGLAGIAIHTRKEMLTVQNINFENAEIKGKRVIFSPRLKFSNCNFKNISQFGIGQQFHQCDFRNMHFDITNQESIGVNLFFTECNFSRVNFIYSIFDSSVVFKQCNFTNAIFGMHRSKPSFEDCNLTGSDFSQLLFREEEIPTIDFFDFDCLQTEYKLMQLLDYYAGQLKNHEQRELLKYALANQLVEIISKNCNVEHARILIHSAIKHILFAEYSSKIKSTINQCMKLFQHSNNNNNLPSGEWTKSQGILIRGLEKLQSARLKL